MRRNIVSLAVLLTAWLLMGIAVSFDRAPSTYAPKPAAPIKQ